VRERGREKAMGRRGDGEISGPAIFNRGKKEVKQNSRIIE